MPKGITIGECQDRRKQIIDAFNDEVKDNFDWLDDLFGFTPTVADLLKGRCCTGEPNGCNCEELLQYYSDQSDVIEKLEAYIAAGIFTSFPKSTVLATASPWGIRPKGVSCCLKKLIDAMEAYTTSSEDSPIALTATLYSNVYMAWLATKSAVTGSRTGNRSEGVGRRVGKS